MNAKLEMVSKLAKISARGGRFFFNFANCWIPLSTKISFIYELHSNLRNDVNKRGYLSVSSRYLLVIIIFFASSNAVETYFSSLKASNINVYFYFLELMKGNALGCYFRYPRWKICFINILILLWALLYLVRSKCNENYNLITCKNLTFT